MQDLAIAIQYMQLMDACCNTASNLYHYLFENTNEINIDTIVVAVAELNDRILQLRREIVSFKDENEIYLTVDECDLSSPATPSKFNDYSTKNAGKRTDDAQYELQRNFKGDDSPGGTDLSARLSFTKRALEVKAANEAAVVFKEDYPRDDKSIEDDDERPNRSRASDEGPGTYRKSISNVEKFGKEVSGGSSAKDARDDTGDDVKISDIADEKLRRSNNKRENKIVVISSDTYRDVNSRNDVVTPKIKRKRISRGVQYTSIECPNHARRFLLSCFGSKAKKSNLSRKIERKKASTDNEKFYIKSRDESLNSQNESRQNSDTADNFGNNRKETESSFIENNRMNEDDSRDEWGVKILDRNILNSNAQNKSANSDREGIAIKVKERLDSCIVELNEIIGLCRI